MSIKIKHKPCNGIGKAKAFEGCKGLTLVRTYGLCSLCFHKWIRETNEGKEQATKLAIKKVKDIKTIKRKEATKKKQNYYINDRKWLNQKINTNVQAIARYIDYGQQCLAHPTGARCGIDNIQFHGGHIWTKGGHSECKWNLHNIHRQNAGSNGKGSDDVLMFIGLERDYGIDYRKFVENLKGKKLHKFSITDLQVIYKNSNTIKLDLSKDLTILGTTERIELRNEINEYLNIYDTEYKTYKC